MPLSFAGGAGGGATVRCYHCNEWGHISKFCPRKGSNMRGMRDGREDLDEDRISITAANTIRRWLNTRLPTYLQCTIMYHHQEGKEGGTLPAV